MPPTRFEQDAQPPGGAAPGKAYPAARAQRVRERLRELRELVAGEDAVCGVRDVLVTPAATSRCSSSARPLVFA